MSFGEHKAEKILLRTESQCIPLRLYECSVVNQVIKRVACYSRNLCSSALDEASIQPLSEVSGTHLQSIVVSDISLDNMNITPSQFCKLVRSSLAAYKGENDVFRNSRKLIDKFKLGKIKNHHQKPKI